MPLLVAGLAWLAGVALALLLVDPHAASTATPLTWAALAGLSLVAAAVARAGAIRWCALIAALFLLGWARGSIAMPALADNPLRDYYGAVAVRGWVVAPAEPAETWVSLRVQVVHVERGEGWAPADGLVLLRVPRTAPYDYGDGLVAQGSLRPPPDPASSGYAAALWRQGVRGSLDYPTIGHWEASDSPSLLGGLHALRRRLEAALAAAVPEPHASLLTGVLLGGSATMPADFRQEMRAVGLSHLTAVSGFNVVLVAAAAMYAATRLAGRRAGLPLAALAVVLYTLLVGAPPSALRAAVMALVALGAEAAGRPRDGLAGLALAVALLAGWDPWLLGDLGFQLSVLATAGLILLQPLLRNWLRALPTWAAEGLAVTIAAQAFVLPLQLAAFHNASLVAPLANLIVVPLVPPLMAIGAAIAVVGLIAPPIALVLGWVAWAYLEVIVRVVHVLAALPGARVEVGALPVALGVGYVAALLLIVVLAAPEAAATRAALSRRLAAPWPRALALGVVAACVLSVLAFTQRPEPRLRVAVLDVGQGDATLVRTPNGRLALIDGGPSPAGLAAHLGGRLGLIERQIDLVVLTHPHEDHVAGLVDVVNRYAVPRVIEGAVGYTSSGAERWRRTLEARGVPAITGTSGQQWWLDQDVVLDVWAVPPLPGSRADALEPAEALVLRLRYGATSLLLPGDLVAEQGKRIVAAGGDLRATALRVPHHGSRTGLDGELLAAIAPSLAVVSSGERNRFGHPAPQTLALLGAQGIPVWRTDRDGTIELISDGATWSVQAAGKGR